MAARGSKTKAEVENVEIVESEKPVESKKVYKPKQLDPDSIITVKNGFHGQLVYVSSKTGERFLWDGFGDEQDMELSELKNARSVGKKYFINNWWLFDDPEVVDYLGMNKYYKFALNIDEFESLFDMPADKIEAKISKLSIGQKKSVAYRAKQMIAEGAIDSNRTIQTLERCLGIDLVEK